MSIDNFGSGVLYLVGAQCKASLAVVLSRNTDPNLFYRNKTFFWPVKVVCVRRPRSDKSGLPCERKKHFCEKI